MQLFAAKNYRWLPARFDRLRTRLFVAIAAMNVLLLLLAWGIISWSFDRGLLDYLNRAEQERLQPLVALLARDYQTNGSWQPLLEERWRWRRLLREAAGMRLGTESMPRAGPEEDGGRWGLHRPPEAADAPPRFAAGDLRLALFAADGRLLLGRPHLAHHATRLPVTVNGQTIGYLGYLPRLRVDHSLEQAFAAAQTRRFALVALGTVLAGLLVSAALAHWLTRRIDGLARGTSQLIKGDYAMRLPVDGADELSQLARDFNRLAQSLEAARQSRQQWIADIAHELRTPLTVLRGELEALADGVRPLAPASISSLLQEVTQLSSLVNDLHLLSVSDLGALSYQRERLDPAELVSDLIAQHAADLHSHGIKVRLHLPHGQQMLGDRSRLLQVFANLLQNTLRYTDAPGELQVELLVQPTTLELIWQDSSPGVAVEDLPRLTERLFRVDAARSREQGGSGLGLAIVKAIVEAHEGQMRASSSPLGGVRWSLQFPRVTPGDEHV